MSLGHSERAQAATRSAAEPGGEKRRGEWGLGEDAVPMRGGAERAFDYDREERLRAVLGQPRRPLKGHGRHAAIALGAVAVPLAALTLLGGLGGSSSAPGTRQTLGASAPAMTPIHTTDPAKARRRAATRAIRRAVRRRVAQRRAHRQQARRPQVTSTRPHDEAAASTGVPTTAPPPPPAPAPTEETAPSTTSGSPSQVQSEFGFER